MNFGRRQVRGIIGIALALLGGVAWYYQQLYLAFIAWGGAVIILMILNKRRRR